MRAGLALTALSTLAMGLDERFASWVALRAVGGAASAWILIHVSAWSLERLAALSRPALSGAVYAGVGVGAALAGALCLAALRFQLAARDVWLALGAIALAAAVALWPLFAERRKKAAVHAAPLQWNTQSLLLVACYGAFGFSYIIPATFIPAFARETLWRCGALRLGLAALRRRGGRLDAWRLRRSCGVSAREAYGSAVISSWRSGSSLRSCCRARRASWPARCASE